MSDDLKTLFPGRDVEIRVRKGRAAVTETIFVAPFAFSQLGTATGLARQVLPAIDFAQGNILRLIESAHGPVMELLALCVGRDIEFFDSVLPDDGVKLVAAMIEENYSFFIQNVAPQLEGMTNAMAMFAPPALAAEESATSPSSND